MKSILRLFLVPLVTLAFAGVTFAQATPATPAKPATPEKKMEEKKMEKAEKPKTTSITGELKSVDTKAGTLTVKAKDKDINLTAESKAAKSALEKVKVGDQVRVSYSEKNGKMIASSITKAKGEAKGKEPMAKKEEKKAETKPLEKKEESKAKAK